MIKVQKLLPGEVEGEVDPNDYGFDTLPLEQFSDEDSDRLLAEFYARAKERTGVVIPSLEPYLSKDEPVSDVTRPDDQGVS